MESVFSLLKDKVIKVDKLTSVAPQPTKVRGTLKLIFTALMTALWTIMSLLLSSLNLFLTCRTDNVHFKLMDSEVGRKD